RETPTEAPTSPMTPAPLPTVALTDPVSVAETVTAPPAVTVLGDAALAPRMWLATSLWIGFVERAPPAPKAKLVGASARESAAATERAVAVGCAVAVSATAPADWIVAPSLVACTVSVILLFAMAAPIVSAPAPVALAAIAMAAPKVSAVTFGVSV